jgi:hypothetical protein
MTNECVASFSRRDPPEACILRWPSSEHSEGAGKTGCAPHPRSRVQLRTENAHTSIQVRRKHPGLPCAVALRLITCSPQRTAFLPLSPRKNEPARLDASTATSGPHDFAVRFLRVRLAHSASTASHRTFVTMANAPHSGETRGIRSLICPTARAQYFRAKGWTAR